MPQSKSGSNLRQVKKWQKAAARTEYLRHPDASISDVARSTGVSVRTVARAREELVKEGLLNPGRNATTSAADAAALAALNMEAGSRPPEPPDEPSEVPGDAPSSSDVPGETRAAAAPRAPRGATIDGEALRQMNQMLDDLADEDDEVTRKRMLRQCKKFAFDPNLHPDTRMSASQMWAKLLDMQRAKDIGPGLPQTLEAAIARATDFCKAAGPKVMVPAFYAAFDLQEPNGQTASQTVESSQPAPASVQPAGPTDNDAQVRPEA